VKVKVFVEPPWASVVTLSYVGSFFQTEHRKTLARSAWETKTAFYYNGLDSKLVQ
jgi:hypothetical protein